jgi:hypothetical protein
MLVLDNKYDENYFKFLEYVFKYHLTRNFEDPNKRQIYIQFNGIN